MRIQFRMFALALLAAVPGFAEEGVAQPLGSVLRDLASQDAGERIAAGIALRTGGDLARRALEHFAAPEIAPPIAGGAPKSDQERARITDLVLALGHEEYEVREDATRALIELGPVVADQLREEIESPDPEIRTRARLVSEAVAVSFGEDLRQRARLEPRATWLSWTSASTTRPSS